MARHEKRRHPLRLGTGKLASLWRRVIARVAAWRGARASGGESTDPKAAARAKVDINVDLKPASQVADGSSPITATVSVTQGGFALPEVELRLQVEGEAQFADTQSATTEDVTKADGRLIKTFTDTVPESGYLTAVTVAPQMAGFGEAPYSFTGIPLHFGAPVVDDSNGFADGESRMFLTVRLLQGDNGVPKEHVLFTMLDTAAQFVDTKGQLLGPVYVVETDEQGDAHAEFVDSKEEAGFIAIAWEADETVRTRASFQSKPLPALTLNVDPPGARANGKSAITATASVRAQTTGASMKDIRVAFELPDWVNQADDGQSGSARQQTIQGVTNAQGRAHVNFTSTTIDRGVVRAVLEANPQRYFDEKPFQFGGPWAGVSDIKLHFVGAQTLPAVSIFKNGLHQAALRVQLTLKGWDDNLVPDDDKPSIETVMKATTLIDFDRKDFVLGLAPLQSLHVGTVANEFNKHLTVQTRSADEDDGGDPGDAKDNYIKDGKAYFTLYITCDEAEPLSTLNLGVAVGQPNGTTVYNAIDGSYKDKMASLNLMGITRYQYTTSNLLFSGTHAPHEGEKDSGPFNEKAGLEHPGNFWRRWDYRMDFDQATKALPYRPGLFLCCVEDDTSLSEDYVYAQRAGMVYEYKAYFWPMNVRKADRKPLADAGKRSFVIGSPGQRDQVVAFNEADSNVYLTLYACFGNLNARPNAKRLRTVTLYLYDQYGNRGTVHLDPTLLQASYSAKALATWQYAVDGAGTQPETVVPGAPLADIVLQSRSPNGFSSLGVDTKEKLVEYMGGPVLVSTTWDNETQDNKRDVRWVVTQKGPSAYADESSFAFSYQSMTWRIGTGGNTSGPYILSKSSDNYAWNLRPMWEAGAMAIARDDGADTLFMLCEKRDFLLPDEEGYRTVPLYAMSFVAESGYFEWLATV